jgi:hypothetical protein
VRWHWNRLWQQHGHRWNGFKPTRHSGSGSGGYGVAKQRNNAGTAHARLSPRAWFDSLVHKQVPYERHWAWALPVLALAFAVRAAIALTGDFVLHPDEIMQYLEPAHRLAFGNGVVYWEFFYGARSWLVPGVVAAVLKLFDLAGLGEPGWYIGGVKLLFCALSLTIPAAMYCFARRHFSESAARLALLAGAFWYELAAFAHKPLTELVAMAPLIGLLALCVRPEVDRTRVIWHAAGLAVLSVATRMQYAPVALILLAVVFVRTHQKMLLALASTALLFAVGFFDALSWNGDLFHSYVTNLRFNLLAGEEFVGADPAYQLLWWFALAGGGLSVLCLVGALRWPRRYGLLLGLIAVVLLTHSLPAHKEYRFVFTAIPMWLLIGADLAARTAAWLAARTRRPGASRWTMAVAGALFACVSVAGAVKALPLQVEAYRPWSDEATLFGFVRDHDPVFTAYRYLANTSGVEGVWQVDRTYATTPGYYYLHQEVPFYDAHIGPAIFDRDLATIVASASHLVSSIADLTMPGYSLEREFGTVRILRRNATEPPVRQWREHAPVIVVDIVHRAMAEIDANAPARPPNAGIRFATQAWP